MRRRALLKTGLSGALLVTETGPAVAEDLTTRDERIETWDGKQLAATVYEPAGSEQMPAVLMTHGYGGTKADVSRESYPTARYPF